jgi:DNA-binding beta-propeller fold protein YncE
LVALFVITAGGYWPLWLAQAGPPLGSSAGARRGRVALAVATLVPGANVVLEVMLALLLPRSVRRVAERRGVPATDTELQAVLLLAAPAAAIVISIAIGLPWWVVGFLAFPLELPATLIVQRTLNRLEPPRGRATQRVDAEMLASGGICIAIVAALAIAALSGGEDEQRQTNTGAPVERVSDLAATPRSIWVSRIEDNAVAELARGTLRPTGRRARVGRSPYDLATGFGSLWVADYRNDGVSRVDPVSARATGRLIHTGRGPFGVAVGYGAVWVTNEVDRNVVRIDPRRGRVTRKVTVGLGPRGVDAGEGAVWVAGAGTSSVVRVDLTSGATRRIRMPGFPQDVAAGGGGVWAAIPEVNAVVRLDPATGRRAGGLISVGIGPLSLDYDRGSVWVANGTDGTVSRIDAATGRVVGRPVAVGGRLSDITVDGDDVYVLRANGTVRHIRAP